MISFELFKVIRMHIVAGGILAFLVGSLIAISQESSIQPMRILLGYCVIFFGDLSTHYSNDYFDVEVDKNKKTKKYFSGRKILVKYPKLIKKTKIISLMLLIFSIFLAIIAVIFLNSSITLLFIAIIVDLLGWFYSAPPIRLTNRGLGEATVAFATGFAIPSIAFLSVRNQLDIFFLYLTIPFMFYGFILSLNLEAPDLENDKKQGKTNLATKASKQTILFISALIALLATISFLICNLTTNPIEIDIGTLAIFSLLPLAMSLLGVLQTYKKEQTDRNNALIIYSLVIFNILTIMYLLTINL